MLKCPNKSMPEWKALVDSVGEVQAMRAYRLNEYDVPSVDKAQELINKSSFKDVPTPRAIKLGEDTFIVTDAKVEAQWSTATSTQKSVVEKALRQKSKVSMVNMGGKGSKYSVIDNNGKIHYLDRVTDVKNRDPYYKFDKEFEDPIPAERGNQFDELLNMLIEFGSADMAKSRFKKLYGKNSFLSDKAIDKALTVYSNLKQEYPNHIILTQIPFYNIEKNVAGTADIILVKPDGTLKMIDLKTSLDTTKGDFEKLGSNGMVYINNYDKPFIRGDVKSASKKEQHGFSQNMYRALAKSNGFQIDSMEILPLHLNDTTKEDPNVEDFVVEPNVTVDILADVYAEYSNDSKAEEFLFVQHKDEFAKLMEKATQLLRNRLKNSNKASDKNRINYLLSQLASQANVLKTVNTFVEDSYNAFFGYTFTNKKTNKEIFVKGFVDKVNDISTEEMTNMEAISALQDIKMQMNLYKPLLLELKNLYREIELEAKGTIQDADSKSMLGKLKSLVETTEIIEEKFKSKIDPLLAKELAIFIGRTEPTEQQKREILLLEKRVKEAKSESAKVRREERLARYKAGAEMDEESILAILKDGGFVDIHAMDANLTAASMSSNDIVALYAKKVKLHFENGRVQLLRKADETAQMMRDNKMELSHNPDTMYKGLIKTVMSFKEIDDEGNPVYEDNEALLSMYDFDAFNKSAASMYEKANSLFPDFATNKSDKTRREAYITSWFINNTESPGPNDIKIGNAVIIKGIDTIKRELEEAKDSGKITYKEYTRKMEDMFTDKGTLKVTRETHQYRTPSDFYIDKQFQDLQGSKKNLYVHLVEMLYESRDMMNMDYDMQSRFNLPYVPRETTEQLAESMRKGNFIKGVKQLGSRWVDENIKITGRDYEVQQSELKTIPKRFTNRIPNEEVSKDLLSNFLIYHKAAVTYKIQNDLTDFSEGLYSSFVEVASKGLTFKDYIVDPNKGTIEQERNSNAAKMLRGFIDKIIYGETLSKKDPQLTKIADMVTSFVAHTGLGGPFGVIANAANYLQGKLMVAVEATGGQYFGKEGFLKGQLASTKYMSGMGMLKDSLQPTPVTLEGKLIDAFDMFQGEFMNSFGHKIAQPNLKKHFRRDKWFFLQHMGEYAIQLHSFFAMLETHNVKLKDGSNIKLKEAYEIVDGKLTIKDTVDKDSMGILIGDLVPLNVKFKLDHINLDMHGIYDSFNSPEIKKHWYGRLLLFYRNWTVPGFKRRYKGHTFNMGIDAESEGMYRTFFSELFTNFKQAISVGFGYSDKADEYYTEMERANMRKTATELAAILISSLLIMMLKAGIDDLDDREKAKYQGALVILTRFKMETSQFIDVTDAFRTFSSPSFALNFVLSVFRFTKSIFEDLMNIAVEGDIVRYKRDTGFWDKGTSRTVANFARIFGATPGKTIWTPEEALKAMELRDR